MSRRPVLPQFNVRQRTTFVLTVCIAVLLCQQGARSAALPSDALKFFNNYFITGGYVVGGVGLWNTGTGSINMSNPTPPMTPAPEGADVIATFLYWQVVTNVNPDQVPIHGNATFNGIPLSETLVLRRPPIQTGAGVTNACPLNGGSSNRVYTFRADVQKFLDVDLSGKRVINKQNGYPVSLPSNGTARTLGASLVMIYRLPAPEGETPEILNSIVLYDGTFVKQQLGTLRQRIEGFYDPANVNGQITYIAGSAQSNLNEILRIDTDGNPVTVPAGTSSLFDGASGAAWDSVTRATAPLTLNAQALGYLDTSISPQTTGPLGLLVNDCVSMGAMIYQTQVNDTDEDGLLNRWESSSRLEETPDTALRDPNGLEVPNFPKMGATPTVKDVFIEIAAMHAPAGTTYGSEDAPLTKDPPYSVTDLAGHNHMPTPAVLKMLGDEFARPSPTKPVVRLHFDVGHPAAYYLPPDLPPGEPNPYASNEADDYIIGAGGLSGNDPLQAKGGELIDETACHPGTAPLVDHDGNPTTPEINMPVDCQFPDFPGTVRWRIGFALYKEAVFDKNRKDSFRFGLYAHAKATPKSLLPCVSLNPDLSVPADLNDEGQCWGGATPNPLIHVPGGVSGTAEYPFGGDFLISLGLWDNTKFVGTDVGIASTTMHEFGHTLGLGHGGLALPNCKPNYPSVMNYLFQLGGLMDAEGKPHLGYSEDSHANIDEEDLNEGYVLPGLYRTSWYAPAGIGDEPVKRFCNGLKFPEGTPGMVRVDGTVGGEIDWNNNGIEDSPDPQDVNFDGEPDQGESSVLTGFNDWTALRLNQVGSRRNFAGLSAGPLGVELLADGVELLADGSRITDDGVWLLADGSVFLADGAELLADGAELLADGSTLLADGSQFLADGSELLADGVELLADGAVLLSDGSALLADGSVFLADGTVFLSDGVELLADGVELLADGAVFLADGSPLLADGNNLAWAWTINEPTPKSAADTGNIPGPHSLTATQIVNLDSADHHRVMLDWEAPALGDVISYEVYRAEGDSVTTDPANLITLRSVDGDPTAGVDTDELPNGTFTYVVIGILDDEGTETPESNQFTIEIVVNDQPVATPQAVVVWEDWPSEITVADLDPDADPDPDPDTAGLAVTGDFTETQGTIDGVLPTVTYTSQLDYNGFDSFSFRLHEVTTWGGGANNQVSAPATVSITVTPVNDKPNFTHQGNQTTTQVTTQMVGGFITSFDAGPSDEDFGGQHAQTVAGYIVSNNNNALFSVQPHISPAGTLTYTPSGIAGSAAVTVQVRDSGGTEEGHGAIDTSDPQVFTITVVAVNHAPSGTNKTVTTKKNTRYYFKVTDFGFTDPNDVPPNALLSVKITTIAGPSNLGDLYRQAPNGVWSKVTAGTFISKSDIVASKFKFWPASNKTGTATFTFQVKDDGGTANGGVDLDPSPNVMTINIVH